MKKLVLFTAFALAIGYASAQIPYSDTYSPNTLEVKTVTIGNEDLSRVKYGECMNTARNGQPSLPVFYYTFSVPYNAHSFTVNANLDCATEIQLNNPVEITWVRSLSDGQALAQVSSPLESGAYIANNGYCAGSNQVVTVAINPFELSPDRLHLTMYGNVSFTINWQIQSDESQLAYTPSYNQRAFTEGLEETKQLVINYEDVEGNAPNIAVPYTTVQQNYDYVIITDPKLYNSAIRLAATRRVLGYGTKVFTTEEAYKRCPNGDPDGFRDNAGKLKSFIKYCYQKYGTRHVLLLGKYPVMPIRVFDIYDDRLYEDKPDYKIPTDFYFAEHNTEWSAKSQGLYGFFDAKSADYNAEVSIGRLPAETEDEVNNFIEKLKIYEWNPGNGDFTYLSQGFMTREVDGYAFDDVTEDYLENFYSLFQNGKLKKFTGDYHNDDIVTGSDIISAMKSHPSVVQNFLGHGCPLGFEVNQIRKQVDNIENAQVLHVYGVLADSDPELLERLKLSFVKESGNSITHLNNKNTPGWIHSLSCTLMPFDIYENFNIDKNFGESYILGKDYGDIVMIGNTRSTWLPNIANDNNYVFNSIKQKRYASTLPGAIVPSRNIVLPRLMAGDMLNNIRKLPFIDEEYNENLPPDIYRLNTQLVNKLISNIFGDPLTELRFGEPVQFMITKDGSTNNYNVATNISSNGFYVASTPLSDDTYASKATVLTLLGTNGKVTSESNVIKMIYAANSIPKFLPLYINNFTFDRTTSSYIFADKILIEKADPYDKSDQILFKGDANVTIESLSDVSLDLGTVFESGAKLTINAAKSVTLTKFSVPANVTLIVNAPQIYFAEDYVTLDPQATVIFNGKSMTKGSAKSRSREEAYDPLVREGKIWWYGQSQGGGRITDDYDGWTMEYGFTFVCEDMITEQTFIDAGRNTGFIRDEGPWYRLDVIRKADVYYDEITINDTPYPAHYLKEDDKIVKALDGAPNTRDFYKDYFQFFGLSLFMENKDPDIRPLPLLYNFADNEDDMLVGDDGEYVPLKFKSKERKDFYGTERLVKTFVKPKLTLDDLNYDPMYRIWEGSEIEITEGIGLTAIRNTRTDFKQDPNELFFTPYTWVPDVYPGGYYEGWFCYYASREPMQLRYVTDMDYNIIYEGIGGMKAWELEPSGVEDVCVDVRSDEQWFTLGGISVSQPTSPGVYIRRSGNRSEKVVIR